LESISDQVEGFDPGNFGFEFSTLSDKEIKETEKLSKLEFADVYYTPKEKPNLKLRDCIYTGLFEEKMSYINQLNLPDEIKEVMKMLAYRFIKIDFESVANYYAFNATDLEKRAIERLRCVLVDGGIMGFVEDRLLHVVEELDDANYEEGE
jgi:hypothetical protein